jgi:Ca2+-binding RTX toxin-like protein
VSVHLYNDTAWDGGAYDYLYDVERVYGSDYADALYGSAGANVLVGGGGNDYLNGLDGNDTQYGHAGNDFVDGGSGNDILYGDAGDDSVHGGDGDDHLNGGDGNDVLWGGAGHDTSTGGSDAGIDIFAFESAANADGDLITDFRDLDSDKIDLSLIDARESPPNAGDQAFTPANIGDQAFTWIGTDAFSGVGQLRYYQSGLNTYIQGSTDSDTVAEFTIETTGLMNFGQYDFIL